MTKKVDKKTIQEALKAELDKAFINESPLGSPALDKVSGFAAGVGNMFSNLGGQYRLGKINNQLKRTSDRIKVDWEKAEDVATQLATKLGNSKNPQVQRAGAQAAANLQSASQDIQKATGKLDQLANAGVDKPGAGSPGVDGDDFNWQSKVDEFGNQYSESPVERWIRSWGGDMNQLSKADHGRITKQFMNLRAAGLNPFKIPQEKVQPILAAHEYRVNQINATGTDPFPNGEHLEKILGNGGANAQVKEPEELDSSDVEEDTEETDQTQKAQTKVDASKKSGTAPKLSRKDVELLLAKDEQNKTGKTTSTSSTQSNKTPPPAPGSKVPGKVNKYVGDLVKFATNKGVQSNMMGKYVATHLAQVAHNGMFNPKEIEYIKQFAKQHGVNVKSSVASFGGGNFVDQYSNAVEHQPKVNNAQGEPRLGGPAMPPPNPARMQPGPNQQATNQPTNQKSVNAPAQTKAQDQKLNSMNPQGTVQASPIKQVGSAPVPMKLPKQQIGEPTEVSNLTNFFGNLPEPAEETKLPVPPSPEEERESDLRTAASSGNAKKALDFMQKYPIPPRKKDDMSLLPKKSVNKKSSSKKVSARKKSSK